MQMEKGERIKEYVLCRKEGMERDVSRQGKRVKRSGDRKGEKSEQ